MAPGALRVGSQLGVGLKLGSWTHRARSRSAWRLWEGGFNPPLHPGLLCRRWWASALLLQGAPEGQRAPGCQGPGHKIGRAHV